MIAQAKSRYAVDTPHHTAHRSPRHHNLRYVCNPASSATRERCVVKNGYRGLRHENLANVRQVRLVDILSPADDRNLQLRSQEPPLKHLSTTESTGRRCGEGTEPTIWLITLITE